MVLSRMKTQLLFHMILLFLLSSVLCRKKETNSISFERQLKGPSSLTPTLPNSVLSANSGAFDTLPGTCKQGALEIKSQDTLLNSPDYWEGAWGRSGPFWPRRGFEECWSERGSVCALPDEDHTVCLPGSRRGSLSNAGWALDPDTQLCQPGVFCLYACEPGYYWTQYNQDESSSFDPAHSGDKGNCDGTWNYGTSTHGLYCDELGIIQKKYPGPLCKLGETYVYAENRLDTHFFICQTLFPVPTLVKPGESVMLTTQPKSFWTGPSSSKPTHGDFFVSFAGADIMEACARDGISPSGTALLPYELGTGVEDNGVIYSTHYLYQQPNSEVSGQKVGYEIELECSSKEKGVCGKVTYKAATIKVDVLKRPKSGSTKVKFVFKKQTSTNQTIYKNPTQTSIDATTPTPVRQATDRKSTPKSPKSGRRLLEMQMSDDAVFLENRLTFPIQVCQKDTDSMTKRSFSVVPGEAIQIETKKTYYIGKTEKTSPSCDKLSYFPWILHPGVESRHDTLSFSYTSNSNISESVRRLDFGIFLKCSGEDHVCQPVTAQHVNIETNQSDAVNWHVTYVLRAYESDVKTKSLAYDWGHYLFK